jgi:hypothetical protein
VNAGTPNNFDRYIEVDLAGKPFYINSDLIGRNIEVYWIGIESAGKLAAREY